MSLTRGYVMMVMTVFFPPPLSVFCVLFLFLHSPTFGDDEMAFRVAILLLSVATVGCSAVYVLGEQGDSVSLVSFGRESHWMLIAWFPAPKVRCHVRHDGPLLHGLGRHRRYVGHLPAAWRHLQRGTEQFSIRPSFI
jgi:hypothetical protein